MLLKRTRSRPPRSNNRRGTAAVEFAVIAPLFFLLILAMVEIARMFMVQHTLVNVSREGSRSAVVGATSEEDIKSLVAELLSEHGISGATVEVSPAPENAQPGDLVTVSVSVPYNNVSWLAPTFLRGQTLTGSTKMRKEKSG